MKSVKIKGMDIVLPKGKPFSYDTPTECPKAHQNVLVIGKRGSGKSVAAVNLIEKMNFDRIFVISPTMLSNKDLMKRLNIDDNDVYDDPDDITCLDMIKEAVEREATDLDNYLRDMKKYNLLMRLINRQTPIEIPDDLLADFYNPDTGNFEKPIHKYNGKKPMCGLLIDDCVGSMLFTKGIRRLNKLTILHRHLGGLTQIDGAIGCSLFFLVQSYVVQFGGISTTIRNNATSIILFKTKNEKELQKIVDECSGEIEPELFIKLYEQATNEPHSFLFIDLHKKAEHASSFRKNFDEYLIPDTYCTCASKGLPIGSCGNKPKPVLEKVKTKKKDKKDKLGNIQNI